LKELRQIKVYIFSRMQVYDIVVKKSKNERINDLWMDMDDILSGQHVTGHSTVLN